MSTARHEAHDWGRQLVHSVKIYLGRHREREKAFVLYGSGRHRAVLLLAGGVQTRVSTLIVRIIKKKTLKKRMHSCAIYYRASISRRQSIAGRVGATEWVAWRHHDRHEVPVPREHATAWLANLNAFKLLPTDLVLAGFKLKHCAIPEANDWK